MLYAKSLNISLPFLFLPFNINQPFSLLVLCLRTAQQHWGETKARERQLGVSAGRVKADRENHLLSLAHGKCCSSQNRSDVSLSWRRGGIFSPLSQRHRVLVCSFFSSLQFLTDIKLSPSLVLDPELN